MILDESQEKQFIHPIIVIIICLAGYVRFDYTFHKEKSSSFIEQVFVEVLTPVQLGLGNLLSGGSFYFDRYFSLLDTKDENERLTQENRDLKILVNELEYDREENIRLKSLMSFVANVEYKKVLARVISLGNSGHYFSLRINKGINEGISKNDVVINADGLVGVVVFTSLNYSEISTVLDFANRVDVLDQRSRVHGVMRGDRNNKCLVKFVKKGEDVQKNDLLQTSGMGAVYPKGIKVGKVIRVEVQESDLTKKIIVEPNVNFGQLEEVIILTKVEEQIED